MAAKYARKSGEKRKSSSATIMAGAVGRMRIVTHHQITDSGVEKALEVFKAAVEGA